jgi:uncharacterized membrane protein
MHDLSTLGGTSSVAFEVRDDGLILGQSEFAVGNINTRSFTYDGTGMHDLGFGVSGINNLDQMAGSRIDPGLVFQVFFYDGTVHDLGGLGYFPNVYDLNDSGQIVGSYTPSLDPIQFPRALYYDPAHGLVDLNTLIDPLAGWTLSYAYAINNSGQIVGFGQVDGQSRAFLLTPVPEPSSMLLAGLAPLALAAAKWRRLRRLR